MRQRSDLDRAVLKLLIPSLDSRHQTRAMPVPRQHPNFDAVRGKASEFVQDPMVSKGVDDEGVALGSFERLPHGHQGIVWLAGRNEPPAHPNWSIFLGACKGSEQDRGDLLRIATRINAIAGPILEDFQHARLGPVPEALNQHQGSAEPHIRLAAGI
jgi:hypothetical protein